MHSPSKITMSNIPIYNLRGEFEDYLKLFEQPTFKPSVFNCRVVPIALPNFEWRGLPNDLLTLMLFRSISGMESYLSAAVDYELSRAHRMTDEARQTIDNPFALHRVAVFALFDRLPSLVDPRCSLLKHDAKLFEETRWFYKHVRNPIFHGSQVEFSEKNFDNVVAGFQLMASVYDWIDTWYTAFLGDWQEARGKPKNG